MVSPFSYWFNQLGQLEDIEEAILSLHKAIKLATADQNQSLFHQEIAKCS
jgi:hypothetical protein